MGKKRRLVADFETTTIKVNNDENILDQLKGKDTRVWAWGLTSIDNIEWFKYGDSMEGFIRFISNYKSNTDVYFHNLKFDGAFIVDYLLNHGYTYIDEGWGENKRPLRLNEFTAVYNGDNEFYTIKLCTQYVEDEETEECKKQTIVRIVDSSKIITMKVEEMPKAFGLPLEKLEIDYDKGDNQDYTLTEKNLAYLHNDCVIPAMALKIFLDRGYNKLTMGANALYDYKKTIGRSTFDYMFPSLDYVESKTGMSIDEYCRDSYRGGFVAVNPKYKGKTVSGGYSYDVNALYSDRLNSCMMPCLDPIYGVGEYKQDPDYPLWIGRVRFMFKVKENHIPIINLKHQEYKGYGESEYLEESKCNGHWDFVDMTVTSVDWKLIKEQYNVYNVEFIDYYKFKASDQLFKDYVRKWNSEKMAAKEFDDTGSYALAKRFLNSLGGKFGTKPYMMNKKAEIDEDGIVKWIPQDEFFSGSVYVPISCFMTAYGREKLINVLQANYDNWLYCDTDCAKILGEEHNGIEEISKTKLGAWKNEGKIIRGKYIRIKAYIEEIADIETGEVEQKVVCSALPHKCTKDIKFEEFDVGYIAEGNLVPYTIKGGRVLIPKKFAIKDR